MPTVNWLGKWAVANYHNEVHFPMPARLREVLGNESVDLSRNDSWPYMMYPRLVAAAM